MPIRNSCWQVNGTGPHFATEGEAAQEIADLWTDWDDEHGDDPGATTPELMEAVPAQTGHCPRCRAVAVERDGRSFVVEHAAGAGWGLRESYRGGWPIVGGPFPTEAEAVAHIEVLLAAGPLVVGGDDA